MIAHRFRSRNPSVPAFPTETGHRHSNPLTRDDPPPAVDRFFRGREPRDDTVLVAVNRHDNPWFPDALAQEKESDYASDPEMADPTCAPHRGSGASGPHRRFPHDPGRPVDTAWNIGIDDYTAIRFFQDDGVRVTAIDYHETSGQGAEEIVRETLPELQPES